MLGSVPSFSRKHSNHSTNHYTASCLLLFYYYMPLSNIKRHPLLLFLRILGGCIGAAAAILAAAFHDVVTAGCWRPAARQSLPWSLPGSYRGRSGHLQWVDWWVQHLSSGFDQIHSHVTGGVLFRRTQYRVPFAKAVSTSGATYVARRMWLARSCTQGDRCEGAYPCIVAHGMRPRSSILQTGDVCGSRVVESRRQLRRE